MAHLLLRDPDADGWERSDFPIVCETCLGPNPYVRMQRVCRPPLLPPAATDLLDTPEPGPDCDVGGVQIEFGGECHISGRPYTVFRWRPGNDARHGPRPSQAMAVARATVATPLTAARSLQVQEDYHMPRGCQGKECVPGTLKHDLAACSGKLSLRVAIHTLQWSWLHSVCHCCQVCLLDLDYNLPVQARDAALGVEDEQLPDSDVGREYQLQRMATEGTLDSSFQKQMANDAILKMQRTTPYYKVSCQYHMRQICLASIPWRSWRSCTWLSDSTCLCLATML